MPKVDLELVECESCGAEFLMEVGSEDSVFCLDCWLSEEESDGD